MVYEYNHKKVIMCENNFIKKTNLVLQYYIGTYIIYIIIDYYFLLCHYTIYNRHRNDYLFYIYISTTIKQY